MIGSRYWVKVVDYYSRYSWSEFTRKKDELTEVVIQKMKIIEANGRKIKKIRMYNAGENCAELIEYCEKEKGVKVELTPTYTPQYNGVVERCFVTEKEHVKSRRV